MELINILIFWICFMLIMITSNLKNMKNNSKPSTKKRNVHRKQFTVESDLQDEPASTPESSEAASSSQPAVPKPKPSTVFVADLTDDAEGGNAETEQTSGREEELAELDFQEGDKAMETISAAEVEDDSFLTNLEARSVFEDFFSNEKTTVTFTMEEIESDDEGMEQGTYNSSMQAEEPWFEHESVQKLIKGMDIFDSEATKKEFEILKKNY
ncbi:MAG TPA: hypothetical protein GX526_05755 [Thermoanaerobacterales bacterium]|nr:hypothetical protein [Thermoanaerobacterales bacterium]